MGQAHIGIAFISFTDQSIFEINQKLLVFSEKTAYISSYSLLLVSVLLHPNLFPIISQKLSLQNKTHDKTISL